MNDAHLGDRLSVFLDGELDAQERAEAESHLRSCGECTRALEELAAVDALAREAPVAAPDGYFDALPGRVRTRIRQRRRLRPAVWTAAAAAAVVVLVSVVAPLALRRAPEAVPVAAPPAGRAAPAAEPDAPVPPATMAADEVAKKNKAAVEPLAKRTVPAPAPVLPPSRDREASAALEPRLQAAEANRMERRAPAAADALTAQSAGAIARSLSKAEEAERADGFADRPASPERSAAAPAAAAPAAPAPAERKLGVAGGGGAFAHPDRALMEDQRYRSLAERRPASAEEARALRDAWDLFARDRATDPRADEARVRAIEAGLEAWRLGGDPADLGTARRRGQAYLADAAAPQHARVRAALDGASPAPRP
jgi:putative zinc finger protein